MNQPTTDIMLINSRLHSEFLEGNLEDFFVSMVDPRPITFLALCQIFNLSFIHSLLGPKIALEWVVILKQLDKVITLLEGQKRFFKEVFSENSAFIYG